MELLSFIKLCFATVAPGNKYRNSWHIKVIADRLQSVFEGKITRLIVNQPPRSMKSICVSIAWPAWILSLQPSAKIMVASYSQILSEKLSLDTRCILQAHWYKEAFPHVQITKDQNTKSKFQTENRGFRFATSVGGTCTGEGGDFLIVDDPMNPMQAASEKYRQKTINWFDQTFITRLNDRRKGAVVIVMHRMHVDDLTGHLLRKNKKSWHVLSLPLIAEEKTKIFSTLKPWVYKNNKKKRNVLYIRKENETLFRQRPREIEQIKTDIGSYAFAAQYQQNPLLQTGGSIKLSWIQRYKEIPRDLNYITQSWDTANSTANSSDFSVCTTWTQHNNCFYLLDTYRSKIDYVQLKKQIITLAERWRPHAILVENKASGQQLIQELKSSTILPIIGVNPDIGKVVRFHQILPIIEAGRFFLPHNAHWLNDLECELFMFPIVTHDDQIDSITQYLKWIQNKTSNKLRISRL